jgi:saccharopine dehydrogenase-like NADP-dependent oxidoreductase
MHKPVLILGAGKIGQVVAEILARAPGGGYAVTLADHNELALAAAGCGPEVRTRVLDATEPGALRAALSGQFAVLSAAPFHLTVAVAEAARAAGTHYLDLTEDVASTRRIRALAAGSGSAFIPQCGLAPGFISIVAADLARRFDKLDSVRMRVGALPAYPSNALNYNLTWSTEGVINEYIEPCEAIVEGRRTEVPALEEREEFSLDGVLYEAFNTSGGLGSLGDTYGQRAESMDYKTMRYPGHCAQMRLLMNDLKLNQDRATLKRILENAVPQTLQDVVIVYVAVTGRQSGELREENYVSKIYPQMIAGRLWSAIQVTTAAGVTSVVDLVLKTPGRYRGFVRQEDFHLVDVLDNRFGRHYASAGTKEISGRMVVAGQTGQQRADNGGK